MQSKYSMQFFLARVISYTAANFKLLPIGVQICGQHHDDHTFDISSYSGLHVAPKTLTLHSNGTHSSNSSTS